MRNVIIFLAVALCFCAANKAMAQVVDQGSTGSCTWTLTGSSPYLTLTVSGTGSMGSYNNMFSFAPWYSYRNDITTVNIQQGVTSIGNYAFYYCSAITSVTVSNSVTSIGNNAFQYCSSLASIYVDAQTPPSVGSNAFASVSPVIPVHVPCGSVAAYQSAAGWSSFNNITGNGFPPTITLLSNDSAMGSVSITQSNTCANSTAIIAATPDSGYQFVQWNDGDTSNPRTVTVVQNITFTAIFQSVSQIVVSGTTGQCTWTLTGTAGNYTLTISGSGTMGNYAFYSGGTTDAPWDSYSTGITTLNIEQGVTNMGRYAFYHFIALTSVTIPNSVTTVGYGTLGYCSGLTGSLTVPNSVTTIGGNAFYGCSGLTTIAIPNSVTIIDTATFYGCTGLTSLTIPNSVTTVKFAAFAHCSSLASIYVKAQTPPSVGNNAFYNVPTTIPVYVCGSVAAYQSATGWSNFSNIIADSNCETDCTFPDLSSSSIFYEATCYLYNKEVVSGSGVTGNMEANENLKREHLAKIAFRGLYSLHNDTAPASVPSDNYPSVFTDLNTLNAQNAYYYQAAKALSYLEYGDGITPFDHNNSYFYPQNTVARVDVLKVLLETFNIEPQSDNSAYSNGDITALQNNNPFKFGYIYKAKQLEIIDDINTFRPFDTCLRGEAFLMLYRLMTKIEAGAISEPNVSAADYFEPLNVTIANLAMGLSPELGNFNHYAKSGFFIDGIMPLDFTITYNSYSAELPNEFFGWWTSTTRKFYDIVYQPLGPGWSHTYHSFVKLVDNNTKLIVHWGGGAIHAYHVDSAGNNFVCDNYGVYNELTVLGSAVIVKTKSQIEYHFSKLSGSAVDGVLKLSQIKDRNNNTLTINYELGEDTIERISSVSYLNRSLLFTYKSGTNLLEKVSDPLGREITFTYSACPFAHAGYVLAQYKDAKNQNTTFTYMDNNHAKKSKLLSGIELPKGNYIANQYDNNRRLIHSETGLNGVAKSVVDYSSRNMDYNATANPITVNALYDNKSFSYQYNRNNSMTQLTGNQNLSVTASYTHSTNPVLPTAVSGNSIDIQDIQYDSKGNVTQITVKEKGGSATRNTLYTYNADNTVASVTDPKGNTTYYDYNQTGNLIQIRAPENSTTNIQVNAEGLPIVVTNPEAIVTNYGYNTYGNLQTTTIPALGISSTINYDNASRVVNVHDFLNRITSFTYDNNDNLLTETNANNHTTTCNYDANDNLITITNAKGYATSLNYDPVTDYLISTSFGGATKQYEYNDDGTLKKFTKPDGTTLQSVYDDLGRIISDGVNSYTYDIHHRLSTIVKGGKTLTFEYNGFNQVTGVTYSDFANNSVSYTYDANGNISTVTYPGNKTVTYTYDNLNRMTTVTDWNNRTITYSYLRDSRMQSVSYPNGMTLSYTYDNAGRQTGKTTKRSDNSLIASYSFTLDNAGNILSETRTEPYTTLLLPNENTSYAYNNANRITQAGATLFSFDANGNTTNKGGTTYSYDVSDKLVSDGSFTFEYDGLGNIRSNGGKRYWIDIMGMGNVIAETDNSNNPTAYYLYGAGGLEARILPSGTTEYYVSDYRGSVVAMVEASASANITHKYQYDDFGKVTQMEESDVNPFRYVGKYGVIYANDNLYYMRARFYDPTIGRFLSEDPIWSTNLYPYADNNPIMGIDPEGTDPKLEIAQKGVDVYNKITNGAPTIYNSSLSKLAAANTNMAHNIDAATAHSLLANNSAAWETTAATNISRVTPVAPSTLSYVLNYLSLAGAIVQSSWFAYHGLKGDLIDIGVENVDAVMKFAFGQNVDKKLYNSALGKWYRKTFNIPTKL